MKDHAHHVGSQIDSVGHEEIQQVQCFANKRIGHEIKFEQGLVMLRQSSI